MYSNRLNKILIIPVNSLGNLCTTDKSMDRLLNITFSLYHVMILFFLNSTLSKFCLLHLSVLEVAQRSKFDRYSFMSFFFIKEYLYLYDHCI
jgi:hypothetical protein